MKNTITVDPFDLAPKSFSSFWMNRPDYDGVEGGIAELLKLSGLQKAVSGFVKITCQKDVPVTFSTSASTSFTDSRQVVISADTTEKNFDPIVGRGIHEAMHIKESDFELLRDLKNRIPTATIAEGKKIGMTENEVLSFMKWLWNYIEDCRIDQKSYDEAPGWRGYTQAMYETDWHSEKQSKGLRSSNYRDETIQSYSFRILGLTNKDNDLKALKGLKEIAQVVDIAHISRLKSSLDSLKIAVKMFSVISKYLDPKKIQEQKEKKEQQKKDQKKGQQKKQTGDDKGEGNPMPADEGDQDPNGQPMPGDSDEDGKGEEKTGEADSKDDSEQKPGESIKGDKEETKEGDPGDGDTEEDSDETTPGDGKLTPKEAEELADVLEDIIKSINGERDVTPITNDQETKLQILSEADASIEDVKVEDGEGAITQIPVTVIRNVSESFFGSDLCEFSAGFGDIPRRDGYLEKYVLKGIEMGRLLGSRIKIRNEEHKVRTIRRDHGKIVRRLLHETGFGNKKIFGQTRTVKYRKAVLHLSIDISGSMGGDEVAQAVQMAVAIAKFCSMTTNIRVIISLRYSSGYKAIIATMYDSKRDKFIKVRTMFPYIKVCGGTPEGLCFAAIQKEIESTSETTKSYFMNLSDGDPCFSYSGDGVYFSYRGEPSYEHTKGEVDKMRRRGIKIMSYLIGGSISESFQKMYGAKDSYCIDPDSLPQLAHSLEQMFLEKD